MNAVYAAAHLKLTGSSGDKVMIILSDGNDTGSTHTFNEAMEEIQRSGTAVYVLRYPDAMSPDDKPGELNLLADVTGGMLLDARGTEYGDLFSRIESNLRGRYILGFQQASVANNRGHHALKVEVNRSGVNVSSRREYTTLD